MEQKTRGFVKVNTTPIPKRGKLPSKTKSGLLHFETAETTLVLTELNFHFFPSWLQTSFRAKEGVIVAVTDQESETEILAMGNRKKNSLISRIAAAAQGYVQKVSERPQIEDTLKQLLSELTLDHVNLYPQKLEFEEQSIYYSEICKTSQFDMVLFIMGKGAVIPLHDHPDMTVMSKVLYGSVQTTSFDWVPSKNGAEYDSSKRWRPAAVTSNAIVDDLTEVKTLYQKCGNIHELYAHTNAIMFDLLLPPYTEDGEHDCGYYRVVEKSEIAAARANYGNSQNNNVAASSLTPKIPNINAVRSASPISHGMEGIRLSNSNSNNNNSNLNHPELLPSGSLGLSPSRELLPSTGSQSSSMSLLSEESRTLNFESSALNLSSHNQFSVSSTPLPKSTQSLPLQQIPASSNSSSNLNSNSSLSSNSNLNSNSSSSSKSSSSLSNSQNNSSSSSSTPISIAPLGNLKEKSLILLATATESEFITGSIKYTGPTVDLAQLMDIK